MPKTIRDILQGLLEDFSSGAPEESSQPIEIVSDPPASSAPWFDANRIRASCARDVLERVDDDRSSIWRREIGARSAAIARALRPKPKFKFGAQGKAKTARPKRARTDETRAYFREYMRARRARDRDRQAEVEVRHAVE
jgi:hypothetical protein